MPAGAPGSMPAALSPAVAAEARRKIDRFVSHIGTSPAVAEAARTVIADAWQRRRSEPDPRPFLEEALAVASPAYKKALEAVSDQNHAEAERILSPLTSAADPYVAVHAASMLARVLIEQEKIDDAMRVLDAWRARERQVVEHSFQAAEMAFMRAYGLLRNLQYTRATAILTEFERDYPDAPERLRLTARQILSELHQRRPEQLGDVADLMGYAGRQLRWGLADRPVTEAQGRAVQLLERLIEEAERQEQQGQSSGGSSRGQSKGAQTPGHPAERSTAPEGAVPEGPLRRSPVARPGEMWGQMPARQREKILQSLRKNFPPRYRELVEQYYRQLGKQEAP